MKTLVADDDLTSRMLLDAALKKWGCDVVSVANGRRKGTLNDHLDR